MVEYTSHTKWFKAVFFVAIIGLPNLFPLYQLFYTEGYLFYQNSFDEYSYLSYEVASFDTGFLRLPRYSIKWLHEIGISSGYINFIYDLVCPSLTAYFIYKIYILLGFGNNKSLLATVLTVMIPILLGGSNPVYSKIFYSTITSGWVNWLVLPEAYYPPFYRTPDPQLSYLLMVLAIYCSIKRKTFIPLYLAAPFLYGFLRVPYLFVVFSCHLSAVNNKYDFIRTKYSNWLIGIFSYVLVSLMVGVYYEFALKDTMKAEFFPTTRLPLLSGAFVLGLLIWKFLPRNPRWEKYNIIGFIIVAPLVAVNTQIISGFISQPINFEQSFGVISISFLATILALSYDQRKWVLPVLGVTGIFLSVVFSAQIFRINSNPILLKKPPQELLEKLRADPFSVVFEDTRLGSTMSMILPRQSFTALAISQSYSFAAPKYFEKYLCVKEKIKQEPEISKKYKSALKSLDKGYKHLHSGFIFIHLNRRKNFTVFYDVYKKPEQCNSKKLYYYP